ncbi:hypothetical protein EV183_002974 [Coemansia sp. RSA 2336]|nr:hypothetical protein EV183_002974 [Coemansia sp. RSA 2336]
MVRMSCQPVIDRYQGCLQKNEKDPSACIDSLRDLYQCTEGVGQMMEKMNALKAKHTTANGNDGQPGVSSE